MTEIITQKELEYGNKKENIYILYIANLILLSIYFFNQSSV